MREIGRGPTLMHLPGMLYFFMNAAWYCVPRAFPELFQDDRGS